MLVRHYNLLDHAGRTVKLSESLPSQTGGGHCCPGNALCAVRKVYFSAQPNKLRPILKFRKYFPVEPIFVPACSSVRKIHFFKF